MLLPVVILVGVLLYFEGSKVIDWGESIVGDLSGTTDFVTATDAHELVKECTSEQVLQDRKCGETKIVVLDAAKMPFIARNIQLAWGEGKPYVLHRSLTMQRRNRALACPRTFPKQYNKGSCDEYPFASTSEGGTNSRTEEVDQDEQNCQGGTLSRAYQNQGIGEGDGFLVVISHPDKIAKDAWQGRATEAEQC